MLLSVKTCNMWLMSGDSHLRLLIRNLCSMSTSIAQSQVVIYIFFFLYICLTFEDAAEKPSMKEIKGLGERLFGLGQLVANAKGILTNQAEMAQVIVRVFFSKYCW